MAIYHCSVKIIGRSSGRSSTGAAAYRAAEKIRDERSGEVHDYRRKGGVDYSQILAPENAPNWAFNRSQLWNAVELSEKRKDSQLSREVEVALPRELSLDQMKSLINAYAQEQFVDRGMIADINIHHAHSDNPHAHIMLTTREIDPDGFGKKNRSWNQKDLLQKWRESWEKHANQSLEQAGHDFRIDHRTLEAQGIERIPQIHLGAKVVEMEKRGVKTDRGARALEIQETNQKIVDLVKHREALEYERNRFVETGSEPRGISARNRTTSPSHGFPYRRNTSNDRRTQNNEQTPCRGVKQRTEKVSGNEREKTEKTGRNIAKNAEFSPINIEFSASLDHSAVGGCSFGLNSTHTGAVDRIVALARPNLVHGQKRENNFSHPSLAKNTDCTRAIVKKQLLAMGSKLFEIGIRARNGLRQLQTWSFNEVIKHVPWLERENAKGSDIYVRPLDTRKPGAIVVDNLDQSQINRMMNTGFEPALIVEKSPENFTAWVRISDHPISPPLTSQASKMLSGALEATPRKDDSIRLAGFINQQSEHITPKGLNPIVVLHEKGGHKATKGDYLLENARGLLDRKVAEAEKQNRLEAAQRSPERFYGHDAVRHYRILLKRLMREHGSSLDMNKADGSIAKELAEKRYTKDEVTKALNEASPEAAVRKRLEHDYVKRIVKKAFNNPDVKKRLEKPRGYDMGR